MLKLSNFWSEVRKPNQQYNESWKGISVLAALYFIQLSSYRLIGLYEFSDAAEKIDSQWAQIWGSLIGAISGAIWLYLHRNKKSKERNSISMLLRYSLVSSVIGVSLILSTYLCKDYSHFEAYSTDILFLGQFFFGAGWACGIGGAILWCCEFLPPYLRTLGALLIGCAGFCGAGIVALAQCFTKFDNYSIGIISFLYLIIAYWVFKYLPKDARLTYAFQDSLKSGNVSPIQVLLKKGGQKFKNIKYLGTVVISLFLATSVQYSVFFLQNVEKMVVKDVEKRHKFEDKFEVAASVTASYTQQKALKPKLFVVRYIAFLLGAGFIFYMNWLRKKNNPFFRKRILILLIFQLLQFITFCIPLIVYRYDILFNPASYWSPIILYLIAFISGICAPIWILCLLTIAEQFSLRARVFWIIFAPTAYRVFVSALLFFRTKISEIEIYDGEMTLGVLMWGAILTFIGFAFSLLLKERFEKDPSPINDEDVISNAKIRNVILNPPPRAENVKESYLAFANEALGAHFKEVLKTQMYFSVLYNRKNNKINPLKFIQNRNTFDSFSDTSNGNEYLALELISDLMEQKALMGIINELEATNAEDNTKINGAVLWYAPKPCTFSLKDYENYQVINLAEQIELSIDDLQKLVTALGQPYETKAEQEKKQAYFKNFAKKIAEENSVKQEGILLYLILRADVERFKYGHYFLHIILPYTLNSQVRLVLKTSERFTAKRLEELRSLISFVENEVVQKKRLIKLSEEERLKGIFYRNQSDFFRDRMETHFIGDVLALPLSYLKDDRTHPKYKAIEKITKESRALFKNLHSTDSLITIGEDIQHCQQYLVILEEILKMTRNDKFRLQFTATIEHQALLTAKIPSFILINLMHNCIEYCIVHIFNLDKQKRNYTITIDCTIKAEKECLVMEIMDNGNGFSKENLDWFDKCKTVDFKEIPNGKRRHSTQVIINFFREMGLFLEEKITFLHLNRLDASNAVIGAKVVIKLPFSCIDKYLKIQL